MPTLARQNFNFAPSKLLPRQNFSSLPAAACGRRRTQDGEPTPGGASDTMEIVSAGPAGPTGMIESQNGEERRT